jgi:hypothetical protein
MDLTEIISNNHKDYEKINLDEYDFIAPTSIEYINNSNEKFIDITVEDDNSFYIYLDKSDEYILSNNCDGSHIAGLYIGFFSKYAKTIIENKKLFRLRTPIVCLRNNKNQIEKMFFNLTEYRDYEKNNTNSKLVPQYFKGLGSWKSKDLKELINKYGLDYFLEPLVYDEESITYIHNWMDGKEAESRKEYLRNYSLDLDKI